MQRLKAALIITSVLSASAVLAHSGVKDHDVMARMESMKILGQETKVLGQMMRGKTSFDVATARAAMDALILEAGETEALFKPRSDDPKSEALPTIWTEPDRFADQLDAMNAVLAGADVSTPDQLEQSLRRISASCSACHKEFRE
ncbi:MAG: cytochrome c [Boseongicola sp.]|nr:MAG: cytochrome c [Boseongicola sp.]